jgi:hypothetical protein
MISLPFSHKLQKAGSKKHDVQDSSMRMSLSHRMAFRKETIHQAVRESFTQMGVIARMYTFRVVPADERYHRFYIMIDVAKSFTTDNENRTKSFMSLERVIRTKAHQRFGVSIDAMYWRVSETEVKFERKRRASDTDIESSPAELRSASVNSTTMPLARRMYHHVSAEETHALLDALHPNPSVEFAADQA